MSILYINYNYNNETFKTYSLPLPTFPVLRPFHLREPTLEITDGSPLDLKRLLWKLVRVLHLELNLLDVCYMGRLLDRAHCRPWLRILLLHQLLSKLFHNER